MAHFSSLYSKASRNFSLNCLLSSVLAYLTFQKTIAIFLKYSIQNSSLVADLTPPVLKNINEHLFKLKQCFAKILAQELFLNIGYSEIPEFDSLTI